VKIANRAGQFDLIVVQPAKSVGDGGDAFAKHGSIGNDEGVGLELFPIFLDVVPEANAADFLFAFDEDFDVDGEISVEIVDGLKGFEVDVNLAFVVGSAASVDVAVADGWFESGSGPEMKRLGGLDVIMTVEKNGGFAGGLEGFGINERVESGGDDFNGSETRGTEMVGDPACGAFDIRLMFGFGADAGDAEKLVQLGKVLVTTGIDEFGQSHRDGLA
jgi:hypothetical protein